MTGPPDGSWSEFVAGRAQPRRVEPVRPDTSLIDESGRRPSQHGGGRATGRAPRRSLSGRFAVALAGLLSAGTILLGLALLLGMLVVPSTGGTGLTASKGPGWTRVTWHLAVGLTAEIALIAGRRGSWPVRIGVAVPVIGATITVLALSWWS